MTGRDSDYLRKHREAARRPVSQNQSHQEILHVSTNAVKATAEDLQQSGVSRLLCKSDGENSINEATRTSNIERNSWTVCCDLRRVWRRGIAVR